MTRQFCARIMLVLLALALAALELQAAEPQETKGSVDEITVYRNQALVLRKVDVKGPAGLHEVVGALNDEGVSDMILYGSSPARASRRVEGESFLFVSAGTVVAEPSATFSHPRWAALARRVRG